MNISLNRHFGSVVRCSVAIAVAALLVMDAAQTPAGIQGSGLQTFSATGPVTQIGAGSLVVGGVEYVTGGAQFDIDGHPGEASQLHVGDVVSLHGATAPARTLANFATDVAFSGNVRGRVINIDPAARTFQVLGQTVRVDAQTRFGAGDFAELREGDAIEASGFPDSTGVLRALRIDPVAAAPPARVLGAVRNLDPQRMTFQINLLTVGYGAAEVDGVLTEGATVAAEGSAAASGDRLTATNVSVQPAMSGRPGEVGRIEGLVTAMASDTYFEVNGQPVALNAQTRLLLSAAPLQLNVTVRVSGTFASNGVLVARQVRTGRL